MSLSSPLSADSDRVPAQSVAELFPGKLSLTQSRIDKFSGCPFSYYAGYVLGLGERASGTINSSDVGNLVHHILEMFFKRTAGREYPIPDGETEALVNEITEEYITDILRGDGASAKRRYLFRRLRRSTLVLVHALMEEFSETSFEPYRFELKFEDKDDTPSPLVFTAADGTKVSLYGTLDRVDRFEKDGRVYIRVVDYKTYDKTFRLDDIQKGINLFALWKGREGAFRRTMANGGEIVPAGMFYLSSDPNGVSTSSAVTPEDAFALAAGAIERSGLALEDEDALEAMGTSCGTKYIKKNKVSLVTIEKMGEIYDEIRDVVTRIADEIRSGSCGSSPVYHDGRMPCDNCAMKPVCRHIERGGESDE